MGIESLESMFGIKPGSVRHILGQDSSARYRPLARLDRAVYCPCPELKAIQRNIAQTIAATVEPHHAAHGYVKGRSIITNAKCHVGMTFVLGLDFSDFYGSITEAMVSRCLRDIMGWGAGDTDAVINLCCHRGRLPQGAPSSPLLSNLVCIPLDERLYDLARKYGCNYTRFSDDITFSTPSRRFPDELASADGWGRTRVCSVGGLLRAAIEEGGFRINPLKTRLQPHELRQIVTGLVVNDGVNVRSAYLRMLRASLRTWEQKGLQMLAAQLGRRGPHAIPGILRGRIAYVGQVRGLRDRTYSELLQTYRALSARDRQGPA
jgi:RNA-directed DNA polymerase